MLCCVVLYCICIVLYCIVLRYIILYYIMLCIIYIHTLTLYIYIKNRLYRLFDTWISMICDICYIQYLYWICTYVVLSHTFHCWPANLPLVEAFIVFPRKRLWICSVSGTYCKNLPENSERCLIVTIWYMIYMYLYFYRYYIYTYCIYLYTYIILHTHFFLTP